MNIFNHLKTDIERKFGSEIKYSRQCQLLAEKIFEITDRRLSVSTIKRAFGIIHSSFKPSRYTLDTLAHYAGFENWNLYRDRESKSLQGEFIPSLNDSIKSITEKSLSSILHKTRYDRRKFIRRAFATRYLEKFLQSEKIATMLVAPKGYGKSSILMQWFGYHSSAARYDNNTICLIDGGIYFAIYNMSGHPAILNQMIDFEVKECPGIFMKGKTGGDDRRNIIVIDDIDEVFPKKDRYYSFVKNIMQILLMNKDNPCFKMIFTCRPENLDPFTSLIIQNPLLADLWYHVHFFSQNHLEAINIPLFNQKELKALVRLNDENLYNYYVFNHPDLIDVICHPHFFNLTQDHWLTPEFTEFSYLDFLIQQIIYAPPYTTEKQLLVKTFFRLCHRAEETDFVDKEHLIEEPDCLIAYNELLASGVIYEFLETKNSFDIRIKVRFSNNRIFEHLLLRFLTQDTVPDIKFIKETLLKYRRNPVVESMVLKGMVKYAFSLKNYKLIKQIFSLEELSVQDSADFKGKNIPSLYPAIHEALISCFRNDKPSQDILMPWMAKSQLGKILCYEELFDMDNQKNFPPDTLSFYQKHNPTMDGKVIASFIPFIKGFYTLDENSCQREWKKVQSINLEDLTDPVAIRHYFSMAFIYRTYFTHDNCDDLLTRVFSISDKLREESIQNAALIPVFELTVLLYLNTCNQFKYVQELSEHVEAYYSPSNPESSCYWQYYKLCLARSFLHTGNPSLALEIYRQFKSVPFPVHLKHHMQINTNLIKAEFLIFNNKNKEATSLLQDIKSMADFLDFRILSQRADELQSSIISKKLV